MTKDNKKPHKYGLKIKWYREKKNMTPNDLAKATGLSHGYVNLIERGAKNDIKISNLIKIASALDVTLDHLLTYDLLTYNNSNLDDSDLVAGFCLLPNVKKEYILALIYSYFKLKNQETKDSEKVKTIGLYTNQLNSIMEALDNEKQKKLFDMIVKIMEFID